MTSPLSLRTPRPTPSSSTTLSSRHLLSGASEHALLGLLRHRSPSPGSTRHAASETQVSPSPSPHARPLCPRCGERRVHRWGQFSGRQRFRCASCYRTFSDLTGTPLAKGRRIDAWPPFLQAMDQELTLRKSAQLAGISVSTAFRWRHKVLAHIPRSSGRFRFGLEASFAKAPYPRTTVRRSTCATWIVGVMGKTEKGTPVGIQLVPIDTGDDLPPRPSDWKQVFRVTLKPGCRVRPPAGVHSPFRRAASMGWTDDVPLVETLHWEKGPKPSPEARNQIAKFARWMRRFRGTARSYLSNYLRLYELLHAKPSSGLLPVPRDAGPPRRVIQIERLWNAVMQRERSSDHHRPTATGNRFEAGSKGPSPSAHVPSVPRRPGPWPPESGEQAPVPMINRRSLEPTRPQLLEGG